MCSTPLGWIPDKIRMCLAVILSEVEGSHFVICNCAIEESERFLDFARNEKGVQDATGLNAGEDTHWTFRFGISERIRRNLLSRNLRLSAIWFGNPKLLSTEKGVNYIQDLWPRARIPFPSLPAAAAFWGRT